MIVGCKCADQGACGQGSNVAGVEADSGEQESLLAEGSEVGNNLGDDSRAMKKLFLSM